MSLLEPLPKADEFSGLRRGMMFYTSPSPSSPLKPYAQRVQGEVYKARDTKLDREVAIKVLPTVFAQDRERLARFKREARLLAALNHPNIATIHDLEESNGVHFLVLEFVPGETLAERIKRGPIPVEQALPLFKQIAEGLEVAHEKGIVHRDLKPANTKITPDGAIKILDFGLAKAMAGESPDQGLSESPTMTRGATEAGILLGTAVVRENSVPTDFTGVWLCCMIWFMHQSRFPYVKLSPPESYSFQNSSGY